MGLRSRPTVRGSGSPSAAPCPPSPATRASCWSCRPSDRRSSRRGSPTRDIVAKDRTMPTSLNQQRHLSRRDALRLGALGLAASTLGALDTAVWRPRRVAHASPAGLPNIQFDVADYIAPAETIDGT